MRTRSSSNLIVESSTTLKRHNRRRSKQRVEPLSLEETSVVTMADQRTMEELLQAPTEGYGDAIVIPAILAENFELKHGLLNLVTSKQFYKFEKEDLHARWFNKITSTIKYKDVPNSSIKLMLFPFSIEGFEETFSEAWDRFKDLLRACPHHGFTELHQLDTFYNTLNPTDQDSLNAAAGGNLLTKTPRDALTIIENKSRVRNSRNKPVVSKVSANTSSSTTTCPSEMAALTDAVNAMLRHVKTSPPETVKENFESCVTYGGPHPYYECLAADGNTFNASAAATTYNQNQGYRPQGETNYCASNQIGPPGFPPVQNNQNCFNQNHGYNQNRGNNFNQGNHNYQASPQVGPSNDLSNYMKTNDNNTFKNELRNELMNDIKNMMSSFFQMNIASSSGSGSLPSNTVANPRGDLKAITISSSKGGGTGTRVVDYVVDPRVPLILERPFLRTARALIDVYGEELTLRVDDEAITFEVGQTSRYSYNNAKLVNRIDVIDISCEEYAQEVLGFSNSSTSGNPTPSFDPILSTSFPPLTPFEGDHLLPEKLLNDDPSSPLPPKELHLEEIKTIKSSIDDPPELEIKDLPSHL
ncbi:hypothetical protein Tco_0923372 [Tanacetum coccineum]|uniref:Reverse transcriptase domain-containing protein n=1 Tax=Tanacetum coccineum TaxID=301880 RepID=A0ABQ5D455_9ASTR